MEKITEKQPLVLVMQKYVFELNPLLPPFNLLILFTIPFFYQQDHLLFVCESFDLVLNWWNKYKKNNNKHVIS